MMWTYLCPTRVNSILSNGKDIAPLYCSGIEVIEANGSISQSYPFGSATHEAFSVLAEGTGGFTPMLTLSVS